MADVHTREIRSLNMSRIRAGNNKSTELRLIQIMRNGSITGWRRQYKLFGKPDFVFPTQRVAVFVDGCFWHKCPKHSNQPINNFEFWKAKLEGNTLRDKVVNRTLRASGWRIVRIWQHDLRAHHEKKIQERIRRALRV